MEEFFLISGAIISLGLFAFLIAKFDFKIKRIAVYAVSAILSLLLSYLLLKLLSQYLSKKMGVPYEISFSFYLTMVLFLIFSAAINKICLINTEKTAKLVAAPLMLFLSVSKIGCYFNGCCFADIANYTIPLNLIESGLSLLLLVLVLTNKIKPNLLILIFYSFFRLLTDFFKTNYRYESIDGLTMSQFLYMAVIIVSMVIITTKKNKKD